MTTIFILLLLFCFRFREHFVYRKSKKNHLVDFCLESFMEQKLCIVLKRGSAASVMVTFAPRMARWQGGLKLVIY